MRSRTLQTVNEEGFLRKIFANMFHVKHLRSLFAVKRFAKVAQQLLAAASAEMAYSSFAAERWPSPV